MPKTKNGDLTPKQALFVAEYCKDHNATQAALRAGYSPRTAAAIGGENLEKPAIKRAIDAAQQAAIERVQVELDDILLEAAAIGLSDIADAFDEAGRLLPVRQMPRRFRRAIASIKVTKKNLTAGDGVTEDVVEIKTWDKNRGLELYSDIAGFRVKRTERGKPGEFSMSEDEKLAKLRGLVDKLERRQRERGGRG